MCNAEMEPTSRGDAMTVQEKKEKSATRKLWDELAQSLAVPVSGAKLRNYHCAGRSEIIRLSNVAKTQTHIVAHVARRKTEKPDWQEICYTWLAAGNRNPVVMETLLAELIEKTPPGISLVAFSQSRWLAVALSERGFKAISPNYELLPKLAVPPTSACYVLRR